MDTLRGSHRRSKARLTITLPHPILDRLDALVDRQIIRNRSHAVEHVLRQHLSPRINQAVILAGKGDGKRSIPPLLEIHRHKLMAIQIELLKRHGISTVYVLAGPHRDALQREIGFGKNFGITIIYLREDAPLGTAGALKLVEPYLHEENILVLHGDILTDLNLTEFVAFHEHEGTGATIAVKPRVSEEKFGKVLLTGNRITDFIERDSGNGISIVNTGVYLLHRSVMGMIPTGSVSRLETDLFPQLARTSQLSAFLFQGMWYDVSSDSDYREAVIRWKVAHA